MTCCSTATQTPVPAGRSVWRLLIAVFLAGNCMVLSLSVNISELTATERYGLHGALMAITGVVILLVGGRLASRLAIGRRWHFAAICNIEALFATGILGASAYSLHTVWCGTGDVYFEVICILLVIYAASSEVKEASQQRTLRALRAALPSADVATCVSPCGAKPRAVPIASIAVGDHIVVHAGEILPVDGIVLGGVAFINEATLTGEGFCVRRGRGDRVRAGTQDLDGCLHIRATARGAARQLDQIAAEVMKGLSERGPLERQADRAARWFFPVISITAATTFLCWWRYGNPTEAFLNAVAVLLVACPCALGFATPVGLWAAWIKLARLGIVPRDTASIERLAAVDTVLFDKTGTLTHVEMMARACKILPGSTWTEAQAVALACAAQTMSNHPIARAFAATPRRDDLTLPYRPLSLRLLPGRGIEVCVVNPLGGQRLCLRLGDPARLAVPMSAALAAAVAALSPGARPLALFINDRAVAVFELVERSVAGTAAALMQLTSLGLVCSVCSGDVVARLKPWNPYLPQGLMTAGDKAAQVRHLAAQGKRVCFVGDGINDAPALAQSHVSLAIASGARLASLAADFTLPHGALPHLPEAIIIARTAMRLLRSNLALAAVYNAVGIALAAAGQLHPVFAAVLMLGSSLTVTWRAVAWQPRIPRLLASMPRGA